MDGSLESDSYVLPGDKKEVIVCKHKKKKKTRRKERLLESDAYIRPALAEQ